jgi:hypothetical protein
MCIYIYLCKYIGSSITRTDKKYKEIFRDPEDAHPDSNFRYSHHVEDLLPGKSFIYIYIYIYMDMLRNICIHMYLYMYIYIYIYTSTTSPLYIPFTPPPFPLNTYPFHCTPLE